MQMQLAHIQEFIHVRDTAAFCSSLERFTGVSIA